MQAKGALKFTKMQGLGNDFILVENWDKKIEQPAALARRICARRLSAGADGLMLIEPSAGKREKAQHQAAPCQRSPYGF